MSAPPIAAIRYRYGIPCVTMTMTPQPASASSAGVSRFIAGPRLLLGQASDGLRGHLDDVTRGTVCDASSSRVSTTEVAVVRSQAPVAAAADTVTQGFGKGSGHTSAATMLSDQQHAAIVVAGACIAGASTAGV